jgi:hypothetical protein
VLVQVGPLSSGAVTSWVSYARTVLARGPGTDPAGPALDADAVAVFEQFLDEWEVRAARNPEFLWIAEVDPDQARYLSHAFFSVVSGLATEADRRGFPLAPPEADEFYRALVTAFLDALAQEGGDSSAFADELRESWPGFKPEV